MPKLGANKSKTMPRRKAAKRRKDANVARMLAGIKDYFSKLLGISSDKNKWIDVIHLWDDRFRVNAWSRTDRGDSLIKENNITHTWFVRAEVSQDKDKSVSILRKSGGELNLDSRKKY